MPVIYTGFACTPNFTDNVSVLGKAVNITSTLRGCKLTLIKTVMNTGKTFTFLGESGTDSTIDVHAIRDGLCYSHRRIKYKAFQCKEGCSKFKTFKPPTRKVFPDGEKTQGNEQQGGLQGPLPPCKNP